MAARLQIGTHDGSFHCDEALACWLLRQTEKYSDAEIVRTRDPKKLAPLPIIVDVGATYDPETNRYDHHQKGFTETLTSEHKTKLSSAGLIYKHFGREVIRRVSKCEDEKTIELVFFKLYSNFIEALDAIDNGISQYPADLKPLYTMNTDLSARVGRLNPAWNESGVDVQERFESAVALTGSEFSQALNGIVNIWLPARDIVQASIDKRFEAHSSGEIVVLTQYTVWPKHLLTIEEEMKLDPSIKYVLYQDQSGSWRIQAVPVHSGSFTSRKPLPSPWRGVRDEILSDVTGIPDCVFTHAGGFIGGNKTFEGVLKMAVAALEFVEPEKQETPKRAAEEAVSSEPPAKKQKLI